ncbi:MAG: TipAS antibiotic-recognition domain-containing protein, partial [Bacillota bacterium]|nr:TipAS antibiotic-recognition domain-containing protein [Bacillota bacterium]
EKLEKQQMKMTLLIKNVDKTINARKGLIIMKDKEKFEGIKQNLIQENEKKYGTEIRQKYGEKAVKESNEKFMGLSEEDYAKMQETAQKINALLEKAVLNGEDPAGETGKEIAALHREWLGFTWKGYSPEAHIGLTQMYLDDERFTKYYDKNVKGCAEFLNKAVKSMLGK